MCLRKEQPEQGFLLDRGQLRLLSVVDSSEQTSTAQSKACRKRRYPMGLRRFVSRLWRKDTLSNSSDGAWVRGKDVRFIEPYTTAQVTHNFSATVGDELTVVRGTRVKAMYREEDWIYVEAGDGRRGFVPQEHCRLRIDPKKELKRRVSRKDSTRHHQNQVRSNPTLEAEKRWEKSNLERFLDSLPSAQADGETFHLKPQGTAVVQFDFNAEHQGDVSVTAGEKLKVLNADDSQWMFVETSNGQQGFVPLSFVHWPFEVAPQELHLPQDLLVVDDFHGRSGVDLGVQQGEWVTAVYNENTHWLWAKRVRDGVQGFIPTKSVVLATNL